MLNRHLCANVVTPFVKQRQKSNVNSINVIWTQHSFKRNFLLLLGQYFHLFEDWYFNTAIYTSVNGLDWDFTDLLF